MSDKKKIVLNTFVPFLASAITMICGFFLPRAILKGYGSEVNGAISSVTQFLGIINFFDLGVTAVLQSALYRPLINGDKGQLSETVTAGDKFFRRIGIVLVTYVISLCFIIPLVTEESFTFSFWVTLILAMGISSFGQYYLGVVNSIILTADQKYYLTAIASVVVVVLNTFISILLIKLGASIQLVKLVASVIFLIKPIFYQVYIKKHYQINRKVIIANDPLKQKWNGVAQHVCAVVLDGTDIIVLTIFSTLVNVSIYYVYHLVITAIRTFFLSMTNAISPYLGKLWANNDIESTKRVYSFYEWLINAITTFVFGCTASLIVPFVMLYTRGVNDADYFQPLFSLLLTLSAAFYCLRLPYTSIINATGSYKQTQHIYIIATVLNIIVSITTVNFFGLIGVTIGTAISLGYQTIHLSIFCCKKLLKNNIRKSLVLWLVDVLLFCVGYFIIAIIRIDSANYLEWLGIACVVAIIWAGLSIVTWFIIRKQYMIQLLSFFKKRIKMHK